MQESIDIHKERLYQYLIKKYNRSTISKTELSKELGVSTSTLDLYISKGTGIPNYKKLGKAKNAKVVFNLLDVAEFLNSTIKTN